MAGRKRDYLYRRADSQNWWIKLQYPAETGRKMVQKSLGTIDREEAELLALPLIEQHKRDLYLRKRGVIRKLHVNAIKTRYPVGESTLDDGTRVIATPVCAILFKDGMVLREEENAVLNLTDITAIFNPEEKRTPLGRTTTDRDSDFLETYLALKARNKYYEKEAREIWAQFKVLVNGKHLKNCTRDDGRKLLAVLKDRGDKNATITKKLNYLGAPVAYAIKEGKLSFNPFASIAPLDDDASRRHPFTEEEMSLIAKALPKFYSEERLLWVMLATTGMRLGEAFQFDLERTEKGIRFVETGTKTDQSARRLPLPDALLPYLPPRIDGPLFLSNAKNLSRVLLRKIRNHGITDEGKVLHCLRHRAKDRLRAEGCPMEIQYELLGHEKKTIAAGYGHGSPMTILKPWVDKIGLI